MDNLIDLDDDVLHNPFADSSPGESSSRERRPIHARRRHASQDDVAIPSRRKSHSRSHTVANSDTSYHPLRGANLRQHGDTATRPHLMRMLSDGGQTPDDSSSEASTSQNDASRASSSVDLEGDEKLVIVHPVRLGDSLAGVALRYCTSIAALRRANHLWASDSIHLRKELYIPVDRSRPKDAPLLVETEEDASSQIERRSSAFRDLTLRRVPVSELSFFPPSTHFSESQADFVSSSQSGQHPASTKPEHKKKYATVGRFGLGSTAIPITSFTTPSSPASRSPPRFSQSPSLTSLFTATRETLDRFTRLSLESNATSTTTSGEGEQEHELEEVNMSSTRPISPHSMGTSASLDRSGFVLSELGKSLSSKRPPLPYMDEFLMVPPKSVVRTAQLEPSPVMQVPGVRSSSKNQLRHVSSSRSDLGAMDDSVR
ncbi:carbohydrate-binding module family 50 protein [Jaapia argillacea MUCL 33604]|uniref:Carbohydrate-binding module family 50 protein n=1 Tax=Jaapia argillacea MUCL 33604 TaxID=933084 RepID=A0A067PLT0_9AGAM|nr:carbohydrate-binding module family 50 protein [Jaapia argillacea MUCL 33604]